MVNIKMERERGIGIVFIPESALSVPVDVVKINHNARKNNYF